MKSRSTEEKSPMNRWEGEMSDERAHRIWRNVEARLPRTRPSNTLARAGRRPAYVGRIAFGVAALVFAVSLLVAFGGDRFHQSAAPAVARGALLRTDSSPMQMALEEGSQLSLAKDSAVELLELSPARVEMELGHGRVACDVARNPARRFSVFAGEIEVRVVGTKFSVGRRVDDHHSKVEVHVDRGVVEVRRRGQERVLRTLLAGQSWSSEERFEIPEEERPASEESPSSDPSPQEATPVVEPAAQDAMDAAPEASGIDAAQRMFEEASVARRAGQAAEAADILRAFLSKHASDARAGLAAFELGRLEMDSLGQPALALGAFKKAIRLSPRASFREDVLARIAQAHARMGQISACIEARRAYEREYPRGVHRSGLNKACP